MGLNIKALKDFIDKNFNGNYKDFAKAININSITVWRILNRKSKAGEKFLTNLMLYCKKYGYSYEYFFEESIA